MAQKQSGALGLRGKAGALEIPALTLITVFKNIVPKRPDFIQKLSGTSHVFFRCYIASKQPGIKTWQVPEQFFH